MFVSTAVLLVTLLILGLLIGLLIGVKIGEGTKVPSSKCPLIDCCTCKHRDDKYRFCNEYQCAECYQFSNWIMDYKRVPIVDCRNI